MKNKQSQLQATTPFPVDAIRMFLGMPAEEPSVESTPQDNINIYSQFNKVPPLPTGNGRTQYRRAIKVYDGKMPFNAWLQSEDATGDKLHIISSLLNNGGISAKIYLNKLGATSPEEMRGEMLALINLTSFEEKLSEISEKFKQDELFENKLSLNYVLSAPGTRGVNNFHVPDLLAIINAAEKLGWKDIDHFNPGNNEKLYRFKLWSFLLNKYYHQFYHLLKNQNNSVDFLSSYLLTMLESLQMIDPADPYWQHHDLKQRVHEIIIFYQGIRRESHEFVRDHLPGSISILRKKRLVNYQLLHTLWIKYNIYTYSLKGRSFGKLYFWLNDYQSQRGITIQIEPGFSRELYRHLSGLSKSASNRLLEELIEVSVPSG